jgi:hypothetical protein
LEADEETKWNIFVALLAHFAVRQIFKEHINGSGSVVLVFVAFIGMFWLTSRHHWLLLCVTF